MSKSVPMLWYEFPLEVKESDDIIDSIGFETEEEKSVCEDIIKTLEKNAAECIRNDRKTYIPYMGVFTINKRQLACNKHAKKIKFITLNNGVAEAKIFTRKLMDAANYDIDLIADEEKQIAKVKRLNVKFYKKYGVIYGVEAAKAMLGAISRLAPVNFDEEIEEQLQTIYNNERES